MVDNDQTNEKNVVLLIKGTQLSTKLLARAMKYMIDSGQKFTQSRDYQGKGKQTVKQLVGQGTGVANIEISDENTKAFEKTAKKYGVDFAVVKDKSETPPTHLVFFKGRDADAITSAFKEFSTKELNPKQAQPSLMQNLQRQLEQVRNQVREKVKQYERGHER